MGTAMELIIFPPGQEYLSWGFVTIKEIGEAGEEGKIFFTKDKFLHCRIKYIEIKDSQSKLR